MSPEAGGENTKDEPGDNSIEPISALIERTIPSSVVVGSSRVTRTVNPINASILCDFGEA